MIIKKEKIKMGMTHSSWNSDRVAANYIAKRPRSTRRYHKKSAVKVMKASELYIEEYGQEAYQAWKRREEELDGMLSSGCYTRAEIGQLRKENYLKMKEGCYRKGDKVEGSSPSCGRLAAA